jgi:hypothetical protein
MAKASAIRASDSDRDQVAERLRVATVEGRLSPEELEDRLEALHASRTYGELATLVADLPAAVTRAPRRVRTTGLPRWFSAAGAVTVLLAVLGLVSAARRHADVAFPHPAQPGPLGDPSRMVESHRLIVTAVPTVALLVVVAVCATLLWLMVRPRHG